MTFYIILFECAFRSLAHYSGILCMFFSLFYYICVYLLSRRGWNPLSRGSLNPLITRGLESSYHEGVGVQLSRHGRNPVIRRGLVSIYHEGVGIYLSRWGWNPFITMEAESIYHDGVGIYLSRGGWNLIDRFNPATHSRTCKHLDFYAQR